MDPRRQEVIMGKWFLALVILVAAAVGAAYWWLYRPMEEQVAQARSRATVCAAELNRLQGQLADLETVREELRKTSTEFQQQVSQKEQAMAALRSTHDQLIGELQQEIANKQIEVERVRDKLRVDMVEEILFDSGVAELKPAGAAVLKRIGTVLARGRDRGIEVQGHTDNVPIRGALTRRYATNWELSAARATNVARFLQDQAGVDPKLLSASAYAEHHPRGTNETDSGRRRNRRIEILLVPQELVAQPAGADAKAAPAATPAAAAAATVAPKTTP
jgi:chemotaxis protein MotB